MTKHMTAYLGMGLLLFVSGCAICASPYDNHFAAYARTVRASLKFEIRSTKSETNPNLKYQRLKTRPTSPARGATWRQVSVCVFWTFEFLILNLFRISDFEFRILRCLWLRPRPR
jgi:hypothetical protein